MRFVLLAAVVLLAGCDKPVQDKTAPSVPKNKPDHNRPDAALEEIRLPGGLPCLAGLSARLSETEGNRLEIFFEDDSSYRGVVSIPLRAKVTARVTRAVDGMPSDLIFEPTPSTERRDDDAEMCSRFVAKVPWMKRDDSLDVTLSVEYSEKVRTVNFEKFIPRERALPQR